MVFVIDEGLRQFGLVAPGTGDVDGLGMPDLVQPVDARLDRLPRQEVNEPPRRDGGHLRRSLGGVSELAS